MKSEKTDYRDIFKILHGPHIKALPVIIQSLCRVNKVMVCNQSGAECLRSRLRSRAVKRAYFILTHTAMHAHPPACRRCRLRSRAVKRAYFILTHTAMHAHPVRRRMGAGFLRPPTRPLRCALRLLHQNFSIYFSIKLFRT